MLFPSFVSDDDSYNYDDYYDPPLNKNTPPIRVDRIYRVVTDRRFATSP